jgi:hypothetical protein
MGLLVLLVSLRISVGMNRLGTDRLPSGQDLHSPNL